VAGVLIRAPGKDYPMSPRWPNKETEETMKINDVESASEQAPITVDSDFSEAFNDREESRRLGKAIDTFTEVVSKRKIAADPPKDHSFPKKWALVKVEQKRTEHDIDDIPLCVNGKNVLIKRDEWTPLNWSFVGCLRDAKHPIYGHKPGQLRQQVGMNTRFPHQVYEISEAEFKALRAIATQRSLTLKDVPERYRNILEMSA
jgi:hypothetical protein